MLAIVPAWHGTGLREPLMQSLQLLIGRQPAVKPGGIPAMVGAW